MKALWYHWISDMKPTIYNITFKTFNLSMGRLIRFFQRMTLSNRLVDINDLLYKKALNDTADFIYSEMQLANFFETREELWKFSVFNSNLKEANIKNNVNANFFAEFGVWKGYSINYFSTLLPNISLHGFDSFFGLNEDWSGTQIKRGHFNLSGKLPKVNDNVILHPGLFDDTVPKFVRSIRKLQAGIIHIDSDTFESASFVLKTMKPAIKKGTLIIFDEFMGYPNWRAHEFKAWSEFSIQNKIKFEFIAFTQVGVVVVIK